MVRDLGQQPTTWMGTGCCATDANQQRSQHSAKPGIKTARSIKKNARGRGGTPAHPSCRSGSRRQPPPSTGKSAHQPGARRTGCGGAHGGASARARAVRRAHARVGAAPPSKCSPSLSSGAETACEPSYQVATLVSHCAVNAAGWRRLRSTPSSSRLLVAAPGPALCSAMPRSLVMLVRVRVSPVPACVRPRRPSAKPTTYGAIHAAGWGGRAARRCDGAGDAASCTRSRRAGVAHSSSAHK